MDKPLRVTEPEAQEALASLAVDLDKVRGELVRLQAGLSRDWPDAMYNGDLPPTLVYWLFCAVETLLEDHVQPGLELARSAAAGTERIARTEWDRRAGR